MGVTNQLHWKYTHLSLHCGYWHSGCRMTFNKIKKTRSRFQQTRTKRQQWIILFHSYQTKWTELQAWKWPFLRNQETGKTTITVAVVKALSFMHSPRTEFILMIANYSSFFTGAPGNPIGALRRSPIPLLVSQLRQRPRPGSPPY